MPRIEPFRGVRFDVSVVGDLDDVVAPPYDVISAEEEALLRERSQHNVVRIDHPRDEDGVDRYVAAGAAYGRWLADGVLVQDPQPCLYVLGETFSWQGRVRSLMGVIAAVELEPFGASILPHERTLSGPRADRLSLMEATDANLSAIYGIYSDPTRAAATAMKAIAARPPIGEARVDTVTGYRLWATSDPAEIRALAGSIGPHRIYIADGHHRYTTALEYQKKRRVADAAIFPRPRAAGRHRSPYDSTMMMLVDLDDEELTILAVHRLVRGLAGLEIDALLARLDDRFEIAPLPPIAAGELAERLAHAGERGTAFALYVGRDQPTRVMWLKPNVDVDRLIEGPQSDAYRRLDVTILHKLIIEDVLGVSPDDVENQRDVAFTKDAAEAMSAVDAGEYQLALFLNPTPAATIRQIADGGETMPQKSTYFYPKPLTGLVINPLD